MTATKGSTNDEASRVNVPQSAAFYRWAIPGGIAQRRPHALAVCCVVHWLAGLKHVLPNLSTDKERIPYPMRGLASMPEGMANLARGRQAVKPKAGGANLAQGGQVAQHMAGMAADGWQIAGDRIVQRPASDSWQTSD